MIEQNRAKALRWFEEAWNRRLKGTVDELLAPDSVGHLEGVEVVGLDAFHQVQAAFWQGFPDLKITIEDTVAEGDHVVLRWLATGTHRGEFFGIPATNVSIAHRGMTWQRFANGLIVEGWDTWNQGALVEQLRNVAAAKSGTR